MRLGLGFYERSFIFNIFLSIAFHSLLFFFVIHKQSAAPLERLESVEFIDETLPPSSVKAPPTISPHPPGTIEHKWFTHFLAGPPTICRMPMLSPIFSGKRECDDLLFYFLGRSIMQHRHQRVVDLYTALLTWDLIDDMKFWGVIANPRKTELG